jgi:hypothetical protein
VLTCWLTQDGTYDLDLTYITSRIIAMAFPGEDAVGQFSVVIRNHLKTVKKFLDERHGGRYMVFNLCKVRFCPSLRACVHPSIHPHLHPSIRPYKQPIPCTSACVRAALH